MYESQTEGIIKQRMLDRVNEIIDKLEGSLTHDAIAPVAIELAMLYVELERIITMMFAQTNSGEYLDLRVGEFGIIRKNGNKATGTVTFTGTDGVIVPANTQVQTAGALLFVTTGSVTITSGTAEANIEAYEFGAAYNVPAEAINTLPVQVVGVASVINASPTTGGTEVETDTNLLARLLTKVQKPSTSGNSNDYLQWALGVPGVGDAKVFPIWNGNGTVKVILIDSNKIPASNEIVQNVTNYIVGARPIGANVTVTAAESLIINVTVKVVRDTAYSISQVIQNITAKLNAYLKLVAFKSNYVSYAQIGNAIIDSVGVQDYSNLNVNDGTANISIGTEQVAILGTVTVSE